MRKLNFIFTSIILIVFILLGCQSSNVKTVKVNISNSTGFGQINTEFFSSFETEGIIQIFHDAIATAEKQKGIVNMIEPEYDFEMIDDNNNKQGYHLWLGDKGNKSTLMKVDDTHTIYSISAKNTDELRDVIIKNIE